MNKLYSVHDHWTDINKKNDVDIESIDGVITGIKVNGEDYGGSITWGSVYSGTINPEGEVPPYSVNISLTMTASDVIKVVYDSTEYVLTKQVFNERIYYGATPVASPSGIDFSNYPFLIQVIPNRIRVYTETAGLHTLDISQPQSGGGSAFSTAEVTVNLVPPEGITFTETALNTLKTEYPNEDFNYKCSYLPSINNKCSVLLYQGRAIVDGVIGITEDYSEYRVIIGTPITTGGVTWNSEDNNFEITGDGTITASVSNTIPN